MAAEVVERNLLSQEVLVHALLALGKTTLVELGGAEPVSGFLFSALGTRLHFLLAFHELLIDRKTSFALAVLCTQNPLRSRIRTLWQVFVTTATDPILDMLSWRQTLGDGIVDHSFDI